MEPKHLDVRVQRACEEHLDFLTEVDLRDEGVTIATIVNRGFDEHRERMRDFIGNSASAWILQVPGALRPIGTIMCRFRDLDREDASEANLFLLKYLPRSTFPSDGRFTEIYQLWVNPDFRRRGLAYSLKRHVESESQLLGIRQIYTHTEKGNSHVIRMNINLGYRVVREGPMWDDIVRVSLVKDLPSAASQGHRATSGESA